MMIGLWGVMLKPNNFILVLVGLELTLIGLIYGFSFCSVVVDDLSGQVTSLLVLAVAAAESAVALAILVQYYRVRGAVETFLYPVVKG